MIQHEVMIGTAIVLFTESLTNCIFFICFLLFKRLELPWLQGRVPYDKVTLYCFACVNAIQCSIEINFKYVVYNNKKKKLFSSKPIHFVNRTWVFCYVKSNTCPSINTPNPNTGKHPSCIYHTHLTQSNH